MKYFTLSRQQRCPFAFITLLALAIYHYLNPISVDIHQAVRRKMMQHKQEATQTSYIIYGAVGVPTLCSPNSHLRCIREAPERSDTILFWHIPKSGGTTAKRLYQCMVRVETERSISFKYFKVFLNIACIRVKKSPPRPINLPSVPPRPSTSTLQFYQAYSTPEKWDSFPLVLRIWLSHTK